MKSLALVTGASAGIGLDLCRLFAQDKHDLILVARSEARLQELARELETRHGIRAHCFAIDLSLSGASTELMTRLRTAGHGEIDILVNNAGFGAYGRFDEIPLARHLEMVQLNITALTELTQLILPGMLARKRGRILNVASTAAFLPGPFMGVYYATKSYVLSLSEALSSELQNTGVTVTALCPGPTRTDFQATAGLTGLSIVQGPLAMASLPVALAGYRGLLRGKRLVVPGVSNGLMVFFLRFTPRAIALGAIRMFQQKKNKK